MNRLGFGPVLRVLGTLRRLERLQGQTVDHLDRLLRAPGAEKQARAIDQLKRRLKPRSAEIERIERAVRRAARRRGLEKGK